MTRPLLYSVPATYEGRPVIGWARTDTSDGACRPWSFGPLRLVCDIALKFSDDTRAYVSIVFDPKVGIR